MKFINLFIALLIFPALVLAQTPYTLKDLEALEKEKAYQEFFQHATDIRPSERTEYWKEMVANMAEGYLKGLKTKLILKREDFKTTQDLALWPTLTNNEFFKIHRADLTLKWFTQCLQEDGSAESECWNDFMEFWQNPKAFVDMAPKLLKLFTPYLQSSPPDLLNPKHKARAIVNEYFIIAPLLFSEIAELQCKKPEIQEILWKKLSDIWTQESIKNLKKTLPQYASMTCWRLLTEKAQLTIAQMPYGEQSRLSYEFLKSLEALKSPTTEFYSLQYLLSFPVKGDLFNRSWAAIEKLSKNSSKRETLMREIKLWSRLPGDIFTTTDETKKKAILRHLAKNFPDYVDFYAHTCLNFYTGSKEFPQGNPALHCKEFYSTARLVENAVPLSMVKKFEEQFE